MLKQIDRSIKVSVAVLTCEPPDVGLSQQLEKNKYTSAILLRPVPLAKLLGVQPFCVGLDLKGAIAGVATRCADMPLCRMQTSPT